MRPAEMFCPADRDGRHTPVVVEIRRGFIDSLLTRSLYRRVRQCAKCYGELPERRR